MTPQQILEGLGRLKGKGVLKIAPGPLAVKVNQYDALAAQILSQPEVQALSVSELHQVVDAMKWWSTFFASLEDVDE